MNMVAEPAALARTDQDQQPSIEIGRGWTLWPLAMVRSTGFPVTLPDTLRAPEAVQAAQGLYTVEKQLEEAAARALACASLREATPRIRKRQPIAKPVTDGEGTLARQRYNDALALRAQALQAAR